MNVHYVLIIIRSSVKVGKRVTAVLRYVSCSELFMYVIAVGTSYLKSVSNVMTE
jgi:hypothetical protein